MGMFIPQRVGFMAPVDRPGVKEALEMAYKAFSDRGICAAPIRNLQFFDENPHAIQLIVTFGGDGTMLSVVARAAMLGVPIAGINLGRLGFLTTVSRQRINEFAEALATGQCFIEKRNMLEVCPVNDSGAVSSVRKIALNDVTLTRNQTGKMVDLDVEVEGNLLNRYHADGIIIATPTGSSAYSLAAGGPLIWPETSVFCITPICPHSLTNRSVVLPDYVSICLKPRPRRGRFDSMQYSVDGCGTYGIAIGESLVVRKAREVLSLVHMPHYDFAALLRAKLHWQGSELPGDDEFLP